MGKRHRPSSADRRPVTRRYMARMLGRLRDDLVHAVIFAEAAQAPEPECPLLPLSTAEVARRIGQGD
jgi:hypothetical protein